jgi:hypothetical protein
VPHGPGPLYPTRLPPTWGLCSHDGGTLPPVGCNRVEREYRRQRKEQNMDSLNFDRSMSRQRPAELLLYSRDQTVLRPGIDLRTPQARGWSLLSGCERRLQVKDSRTAPRKLTRTTRTRAHPHTPSSKGAFSQTLPLFGSPTSSPYEARGSAYPTSRRGLPFHSRMYQMEMNRR